MSEYKKPDVHTIESGEIVEALGPVSAGSPGLASVEPDPSPGGPTKSHKHGKR